jgi:hypothetical protein
VIENQQKGKSEKGWCAVGSWAEKRRGKWAEQLAFKFYSMFLIQIKEV